MRLTAQIIRSAYYIYNKFIFSKQNDVQIVYFSFLHLSTFIYISLRIRIWPYVINQSLSHIGPDELVQAYQLLIRVTWMTGLSPCQLEQLSLSVSLHVECSDVYLKSKKMVALYQLVLNSWQCIFWHSDNGCSVYSVFQGLGSSLRGKRNATLEYFTVTFKWLKRFCSTKKHFMIWHMVHMPWKLEHDWIIKSMDFVTLFSLPSISKVTDSVCGNELGNMTWVTPLSPSDTKKV